MKKFKVQFWAVIISLAVVNLVLGAASVKYGGESVAKILELSFAFWGALSTTAVVVWSLFGNEIMAELRKPNLKMNIERDDVHCVAVCDADSTITTTPLSTLEIYAGVSNDSKVEAKNVQIVCGRAFVSETGENFVPFTTFRAASFAWLYSNEDNRFLTDVRRSADKFAKILEIMEFERSSEVRPDGQPTGTTSVGSRFKICLPLGGNLTAKIDVPDKYRAILLPLSLLSEDEETQMYYLRVYWKGSRVKGVPLKDELEVQFVSKDAAQEAVAVNIE